MKAVCVFCGSAEGARPEFRTAAADLGRHLGEQGIDLVYGGASVGLMGVVADAALAAGGRAYGVIPEHLVSREVAHPGLTELHVTRSMHERKALMADLSDGFIALPGGFGTLEELAEITTWAQLGLHTKPIGVLDVAGFYTLLLQLADHMVAEGFVRPAHRALLLRGSDPVELVAAMQTWEPTTVPKWAPGSDVAR